MPLYCSGYPRIIPPSTCCLLRHRSKSSAAQSFIEQIASQRNSGEKSQERLASVTNVEIVTKRCDVLALGAERHFHRRGVERNRHRGEHQLQRVNVPRVKSFLTKCTITTISTYVSSSLCATALNSTFTDGLRRAIFRCVLSVFRAFYSL